MKKKIATAISVLTILTSSAAPVYAADDNRSAVISTEVAPAYVVTIPLDVRVPFNSESTDFGSVGLDTAQLAPDKCVRITLESDFTLDNKADSSKTIPYSIHEKSTDSVFVSGDFLSAGEKTALTINITKDDWNRAYAGEYEDTVVFRIQYTDK